LNLISAFFILPESLREEHRVAREVWPFKHMAQALAHPELRPLMLVWVMAPFAFAGYSVALPLWAAVRLGWREPDLARFFVLVGVISATVQGGLFRILTRHVGDRRLLIIGMLGMAVSIAVIPLLDQAMTLYAWTVVLAFSNSLMAPAATGLVSTFAGANEQGAVLGVAQSLSALGRCLGPWLLGGVFDLVSPAAAFIGAGVIMLIGWAASLGVPKAVSAEELSEA
jgi:MFS family permease